MELWTPAVGPAVRERGPSTMLFSRLSHWSPKLWKSTFRIDRIKYYKRPNGVKSRKWCFRVGLPTKTPSDQKSKILFESRKWAFRPRLLSFCKVEYAIALQKIAFPSFWALHAEVLSFGAVEHASGLRQVVFPSFWALEAPVFLPSRTCQWSSASGVSIFLGARGSCLSAK